MAFRRYTEADIDAIVNDTRRVCSDPCKLLTAFLIDNLADLAEEDELWGSEMPCKIVDKMVVDCAIDFKEASGRGDTIRIRGGGYTVRHADTINWNDVPFILQFRKKGDNYEITKNGVYNINSEFHEDCGKRREESRDNRFYFHKVIWLSFQKGGWEKLTDMEAAMYCWATWVHKFNADHAVTESHIQSWWEKYYNYFCLPLKEVRSCFDDNIAERMQFTTLCPFSHAKVALWNKKHSQESAAEKVDEAISEDDWFQTLRKKYEFSTIIQ